VELVVEKEEEGLVAVTEVAVKVEVGKAEVEQVAEMEVVAKVEEVMVVERAVVGRAAVPAVEMAVAARAGGSVVVGKSRPEVPVEEEAGVVMEVVGMEVAGKAVVTEAEMVADSVVVVREEAMEEVTVEVVREVVERALATRCRKCM
jgi:hypothetical protein